MSVSQADEAAAEAPGVLGKGPLGDVVVVLGTYLVLGVLCGVAWWLLVQPALFTKVHSGGTMSELQLSKEFNGDGWYAVIASWKFPHAQLKLNRGNSPEESDIFAR